MIAGQVTATLLRIAGSSRIAWVHQVMEAALTRTRGAPTSQGGDAWKESLLEAVQGILRKRSHLSPGLRLVSAWDDHTGLDRLNAIFLCTHGAIRARMAWALTLRTLYCLQPHESAPLLGTTSRKSRSLLDSALRRIRAFRLPARTPAPEELWVSTRGTATQLEAMFRCGQLRSPGGPSRLVLSDIASELMCFVMRHPLIAVHPTKRILLRFYLESLEWHRARNPFPTGDVTAP